MLDGSVQFTMTLNKKPKLVDVGYKGPTKDDDSDDVADFEACKVRQIRISEGTN
uniref:Uncharacterized protein n=1 Tax=Cucumis melo TaxID=3656 RepID=A0A9I9CVN7_CUCME